MPSLRLFLELAFGVLYSAGALFNMTFTLRHAEDFYGAFLAGAWHEPARWILRTVILPHATAFTVLLAGLELAVAIMIFSRGDLVRIALLAGAVFCLCAAFVSSPGGTVANLVMAVAQIVLLAFR